MSAPLTPQSTGGSSGTAAKELKPSLQGVRTKQRKGVTKAAAKFEPQAFRDQVVKQIETVENPKDDFDAVAAKLDTLGNQVDYRKYEQQFFEILLVGGLLAPGGDYLDDGASKSPFSVLAAMGTEGSGTIDLGRAKKVVDVFNKVMRRYKYLQKDFEETSLPTVLQYSNKFADADQDKLATATGLFIATGLTSAAPLQSLAKEHLVKAGTSLKMITTVLKVYLQIESADHLSNSLRRGGITDIEIFFPANKRNASELSSHFKSAGLGPVVEFYQRTKTAQAKEEISAHLREFVNEEADIEEDVVPYLKGQYKKGAVPDTEFIALVWNGLVANVDLNLDATQLGNAISKHLEQISPALEPFCQKPSTEVALVNTIQSWCYDNTKAMPSFVRILKTLYSTDVLSDAAILYWHSKGSRPQGRQHFLGAAEPLVNFLKQQAEEDSDEDDE